MADLSFGRIHDWNCARGRIPHVRRLLLGRGMATEGRQHDSSGSLCGLLQHDSGVPPFGQCSHFSHYHQCQCLFFRIPQNYPNKGSSLFNTELKKGRLIGTLEAPFKNELHDIHGVRVVKNLSLFVFVFFTGYILFSQVLKFCETKA